MDPFKKIKVWAIILMFLLFFPGALAIIIPGFDSSGGSIIKNIYVLFFLFVFGYIFYLATQVDKAAKKDEKMKDTLKKDFIKPAKYKLLGVGIIFILYIVFILLEVLFGWQLGFWKWIIVAVFIVLYYLFFQRKKVSNSPK